jgi:hypothetical protein
MMAGWGRFSFVGPAASFGRSSRFDRCSFVTFVHGHTAAAGGAYAATLGINAAATAGAAFSESISAASNRRFVLSGIVAPGQPKNLQHAERLIAAASTSRLAIQLPVVWPFLSPSARLPAPFHALPPSLPPPMACAPTRGPPCPPRSNSRPPPPPRSA